jgi:hypothetical protein
MWWGRGAASCNDTEKKKYKYGTPDENKCFII